MFEEKNASQNFSRKLNDDISGKASSAGTGQALSAIFWPYSSRIWLLAEKIGMA